MAKSVHNDVLDAALNVIKNDATQMSVCKDTPTTYGEATTSGTYMLAIHTMTSADYTIADVVGGSGGRKVTIAEQAAVSVGATGTATYVCLCDADDRLLYVTTCTSQVLTSGNTVTFPAWAISIGDPT